jgi:hypothetical protein
MLAVFGAIVMMTGMYVFLALRTSISLVAGLLAVGLLLVMGQFLTFRKGGKSAPAVPKGDASGS